MNKQQKIHKIKRAILNNETHYVGIPLPKRQNSGSDAQIIAYALQQATSFYNDFVKDGCTLDNI